MIPTRVTIPKSAYREQMKYVSEEFDNATEENKQLKEMVLDLSNKVFDLIDENEHLQRVLKVAERANQ